MRRRSLPLPCSPEVAHPFRHAIQPATTSTQQALRRPLRVLLPSLILFLLIPPAVGSCSRTPDADSGPSLKIRGQRVEIEIAETPQARSKGLGGRESLAWGRGLLFVFDEPGFYGFWMKDMRFDIDIVWIRGQRIADIRHRVPKPPPSPEGRLPTYHPREMADRVLEVPAGYAQAHGWQPGDWVEIDANLE